ncbi:MAG TPA: class I SAM-dependent methyltransferase [Xanthomonadales bacterium]|nr:class I SAM-dependent methyltransferase [Xanthomonadales bacterium]
MNTGFKDHFSGHASDYAAFRPGYPKALFVWLAEQAPGRLLAWDCACGNGQAAIGLSVHFDHVLASDASEAQIRAAQFTVGSGGNISYRVEPAEQSSLKPGSADLVTVAQAFHWLDQRRFEREVERVLRPGGILAIWTYTLAEVSEEIDAVVQNFYQGAIDPYWPPERRLVEQGYRNQLFPWPELETPQFNMELNWDQGRFEAYLRTWSAVQRFMEETGIDPLAELHKKLSQVWGDSNRERRIRWPVILRAFRINALQVQSVTGTAS